MAFAWPLAARDRKPRPTMAFPWKAVVPALLVCAGACVLSPPWRSGTPAAAAPATSTSFNVPGMPAGADPQALLGALLVVGGALAALPWILARVGPRTRAGGQIDVVEVRPLGGRRSLMLVQVGARRFLVGASEHGLATLAEVDQAKEFAELEAAARLAPEPEPGA